MAETTLQAPAEPVLHLQALQKQNRDESKSLRQSLNRLMDQRLAKAITKEEFDSTRAEIHQALEVCKTKHQELASALFDPRRSR